MKYIRDYESFRDSKNDNVNEEFLMSALAAAKGAFKNFLTGITAPFKTLKDDFKKGLKKEELKKKVTAMLDGLLKTTSDSINKAEDEAALNQIVDQFHKEFDEKCAEIDKEIQTLKESLITEGVKDSMIAGRVLLGMVKTKAAELKMEFDKKVAAAKDLAGKKSARIAEIKAVVDDFKKKVADDKYIEEQTKKYLELNKIEGATTGGNIILDWGDVEIEVKALSEEDLKKHPGYYQIVKSGSKKLIVKDGEVVLAKIGGEIKKGDKVKLTEILRNEKPDPLKEYETGAIEKIVGPDGKEVQTYKFGEVKAEGQEDLIKTLGDVKSKNPDGIKKLGDIAKLYQDPTTNKDKIAEIEKQLGGGE